LFCSLMLFPGSACDTPWEELFSFQSCCLHSNYSLDEATANNAFFAQVAFTGVIRQILGTRMGFSNAALDAAFPDRLVNEVNLPIFQ
jgi:hypothetical protein